jgi:hypothetical protein
MAYCFTKKYAPQPAYLEVCIPIIGMGNVFENDVMG